MFFISSISYKIYRQLFNKTREKKTDAEINLKVIYKKSLIIYLIKNIYIYIKLKKNHKENLI